MRGDELGLTPPDTTHQQTATPGKEHAMRDDHEDDPRAPHPHPPHPEKEHAMRGESWG